jgi:Icc protein
LARIVQLSDLHLTEPEGRRTRGVDPWGHFRRVLAALARYEPFARLVLTGDLANRPGRTVYTTLRAALEPWIDRVRWIPGNHDGRAGLRVAFGREGALTFADEVCGWRLIGLDSKRSPFVHGKVGARQRRWLRSVLEGSPLPAVVFVHHPPERVGTWWLDKDVLRDARALADAIRGGPVRAVFCGHVHQAVAGTFAGVPLHACPSTAYQFQPGSLWPAAVGRRVPSFRVIDLGADTFTTRIEQLGAEG